VKNKILVWTIPTRVFHWMLAVGFLGAYLSGDFDDYANLHFGLGALVGTLLLMRIIFGVIGPSYSHFKDFKISVKSLSKFLRQYFTQNQEFAGHNPLAALVMLLIMIVGVFTALSGYLYTSYDTDFLEETHELLANAFLLLVGVHLVGVVAEQLFHSRQGTLISIFKGKKNSANVAAKLNTFQWIFSVFWISLALFMFILAFQMSPNEQKKTKDTHYEKHKD